MIQIDHDKCIGCGECAADCTQRKLAIVDGKADVLSDCFECGHCFALCKQGAVSISGYELSEVLEGLATDFALQPSMVLDAIRFRRSVRQYAARPVERELLEQLLQAGRYTATAKNNQGTRFVFVQDELAVLKGHVWGYLGALSEANGGKLPDAWQDYQPLYDRHTADPADDYLFKNAPVVLYICSEWPHDATLAAQNIEMMAVSLGLGVLYNGYLERISEDNMALKKWSGVEDRTIKLCMLIGHPAVGYLRSAPRRPAQVVWR